MDEFDYSVYVVNSPTPAISRRDYFAAMAMQGLLPTNRDGAAWIASIALIFADALIAELDKEKT